MNKYSFFYIYKIWKAEKFCWSIMAATAAAMVCAGTYVQAKKTQDMAKQCKCRKWDFCQWLIL